MRSSMESENNPKFIAGGRSGVAFEFDHDFFILVLIFGCGSRPQIS